MARFLLATIPIVGHVTPMLPVAKMLVDRGHDVWWYSGQAFQSRIERTGARFAAMENALDYSIVENVPTEWVERRQSLKGLAQLKFDLAHFFVEAAIGNTQDLLHILQQFPADAFVVDSFFMAAAWASEIAEIPWAQLGISVMTFPSRDTAPFGLGMPPSASWLGRLRNTTLHWLMRNVAFRDIYARINQARSQFSLPPTRAGVFDLVSPYLYMAGVTAGFEYPRSDLPPQVHFIGPSISESLLEFSPPSWWDDMARAKSVVHVTQGTVALNARDLLVPTMQALADEDVLVVATTVNDPAESLGDFSIPANARVERFIPHHALLPHVDVMVTNGGFNGIQMALARGIPIVAAGKSEDKPEVCARLARSGAGIDLKTQTPTPAQLKQANARILSHTSYRDNAQRLQQDIQACQSDERAADLLETLVQTQQPVRC
ncbi:MAG: nucleotide disphospho-sugar-binding domain-containing protein [Cyanobacteria bacterium J06639_1]